MKTIAFTIADKENQRHADKLIKSFHHFHPDIEVKVYNESDVGDKINYYRATPMFARELIKEYDLVLKLDADQIITGDLNYVLNTEYDIGCVMNFNRVDPPKYGSVMISGVAPTGYMNAGFVAMRSQHFIKRWWNLCNSEYFGALQYKEQDVLNILAHYGEYNRKFFDFPEGDYHAWHGLVAKGEYHRAIMRDGKLILPKAENNYPEQDKELKVLHTAGGAGEKKIGDTYKLYFNEECIAYIDSLIK